VYAVAFPCFHSHACMAPSILQPLAARQNFRQLLQHGYRAGSPSLTRAMRIAKPSAQQLKAILLCSPALLGTCKRYRWRSAPTPASIALSYLGGSAAVTPDQAVGCTVDITSGLDPHDTSFTAAFSCDPPTSNPPDQNFASITRRSTSPAPAIPALPPRSTSSRWAARSSQAPSPRPFRPRPVPMPRPR
jgi:hypothetical protein